MAGEPASAWDSFWRYDRISSFQSTPGAANYGPAIADGWSAFFASLPDRATVVDLCTGNGAIAVLAVAADKGLDVIGTDLAEIDPTAFVSVHRDQLRQIRFLGRTPAEALPFESSSIDAVASQYGIEYSDLERSIPEAVRVLGSGSRLRLAMHAAEGTVVRDTRRAIADADFLIDLDLVALAACGGSDVDGFNAGLRAIADHARGATDKPMLANVHRTLCNAYDHRRADLVATARHLQSEVAAHRDRQSALLAAACSTGAMQSIGERLEALGMTAVVHGEQRDGADLIGHVIEATKR